MLKETSIPKIRAVVAAVQLQNVSDIEFESSLNELRELAKTLGYEVVGTFVQKRASFDRAAYFGVGKRKEIRRFVEGAEEDAPILEEVLDDPDPIQPELEPADPETRQVDMLLIDHDVSPSQARNLEIAVGCEVMDRTMVILEIFHRHASSRAARAQVEIARLGYMAPRLREAAKLAGGQGRQRSGTGGRGAGESQSALDKQKIRNRISELQLEIIAMEAERKIQRARRQSNQGAGGGAGIARVALVGYTNAGKSTLMRALTGSEVLVANKLFDEHCTPRLCQRCWSVIRLASSKTCRTIWLPRLSRRWRRQPSHHYCCTSSTRVIRDSCGSLKSPTKCSPRLAQIRYRVFACLTKLIWLVTAKSIRWLRKPHRKRCYVLSIRTVL